MAKGRKTIAEWIREALNDTDKEAKCTAIALVHMIGTSQKELHSKKMTPNLIVEEIANTFRGKAETYAQDMPGSQGFQLLAFYGNDDEPKAFFPFTLNGLSIQEGLMTEAPSPTGNVQQLMRQNEMLYQVNLRHGLSLMESSQRMVDAQSRTIDRLLEENTQARDAIFEISIRQANENHEHQMRELEFKRTSAERQKFMQLAPVLANTITGKEIFPQSTADTVLVETIAASLTPEMVGKLAEVLPPNVTGLLMSRFEAVMKKKELEAEAIKSLPRGNVETELS